MTKHPLDVDLVEMADHLRMCGVCRRKLARVLYGDDRGEALSAALDEFVIPTPPP